MKPPLLALAAAAMLGAALAASSLLAAPGSSSASREATFVRLPPAAPAGELVLFGHIRSLTPKSARFEMRFDPAWFLSGVTANRAAAEDKVVPPGQPVPNDNYVRDETHRLLTYLVPANAHVTVLTNAGSSGITSTAITVSELAQIVKGKNPKHRPLFESLESGVWIRVAIDTVRSLDQQYHP